MGDRVCSIEREEEEKKNLPLTPIGWQREGEGLEGGRMAPAARCQERPLIEEAKIEWEKEERGRPEEEREL